ncbi:hypothetical protein OG596_08430 [Streptomyces sp. NBC_01102]|uniref:hypothetical protein n=1 Tax=unclassified Streptomyces TaxID=2593676 RepID=UPI00386EC2DE|nr:hypothetical protein OG596_08430 [Streptomyces sp. NBC_01102]
MTVCSVMRSRRRISRSRVGTFGRFVEDAVLAQVVGDVIDHTDRKGWRPVPHNTRPGLGTWVGGAARHHWGRAMSVRSSSHDAERT